jgi:hypothetical protein
MMKQRTDAETVALGKALDAKEVREAVGALTVGTHPIDLWVHLTGAIKRGEDYTQRIVAKADPWALAAALMKRLGAVDVAALVRDSLTGDLVDAVKALKGEAAAAMTILKGATLTECNGKVTTDLTIEVAESAPA